MDGILVAYHNTRKIFGFQYISREEMDSRLFGSSKIGDNVFRNSLVLFESILDKATEKYPAQTLRLSFDTFASSKGLGNATTKVYVEAVPKEDEDLNAKNNNPHLDEDPSVLKPYDKITMFQLNTVSLVNGEVKDGPLEMDEPSKDDWQVRYIINETTMSTDMIKSRFTAMRKRQADVYSPSNTKNPILSKFKRMSEEMLKQEREDLKRENSLDSEN